MSTITVTATVTDYRGQESTITRQDTMLGDNLTHAQTVELTREFGATVALQALVAARS